VRTDHVLAAVTAQAKTSAALAALITAAGKWRFFHQAAPREATIPHVSLFFVAEAYRESIDDMEVQFSIHAYGLVQALAIERALRAAIDRNVWSPIGGIYMRCRLVGANDVPDPQEGVVHRALTFGISLPRERYAVTP
jgi:hypothetical protein